MNSSPESTEAAEKTDAGAEIRQANSAGEAAGDQPQVVPSASVCGADASPQNAPVDSPTSGDGAPQEVLPWTAVVASLQAIQERVAALEQTVSRRLREDETKERMFNTIYQELQDHRKGVFRQINKRVLMALIRCYDNLQNALANATGDAAAELQYAVDEVLAVLYSEEVEPMSVDVGAEFNARDHAGVRRVATVDAALDKTIDRVARTGFRWQGQVLRPAEVHVRRYEILESQSNPQETSVNPA